jgi:hypothetical protein
MNLGGCAARSLGGIIVSILLVCVSVARADVRGADTLAGWQSGTLVQLRWDVASSGLVAGYDVYRLAPGDEGWRQLNEDPFEGTTFVDYAPPMAPTLWYAVRCVDARGTQVGQAAEIPVDLDLSEFRKGRAATAFDKNQIISDAQLLQAAAMTVSDIQSFLDSRHSVLSSYLFQAQTASQLIYDACQTYGISPYVALVTLQKEQGLVGPSTDRLQARLDWAMGWGSRSNFSDQIHNGVRQFERYYDMLSNYTDVNGLSWVVGMPRTVLDGSITAASRATAGLYIYTPWIGQGGGGRQGVGGNYLFWSLWYNTFEFGEEAAPTPTPTTVQCAGDCNHDGQVTVNELINGVSIALGTAPLAGCSLLDTNGDATVSIDELLGAVNNLLSGCNPTSVVTGPGRDASAA